jgi:hypothetical protein
MLKIIMSTSRTHKTNDWGTPTYILDQYRGWFDPCPFPRPEWDGLTMNWLSHDKIFCHPPYNNIKPWAEKCFYTLTEAKMSNQPVEIHLLIPAHTDTPYFHEYIRPFAKLDFIRGRLKFVDLTGVSKKGISATFPSIVCIYKHA